MKTLIQQMAVTLTLLTSMGIFVHDTKIDHATTTALALPAALATLDFEKSFKFGGSEHTHVERVSFGHAVSALSRGMPRIQPREDHKRFFLNQKVAKGTHPFDSYNMPQGVW